MTTQTSATERLLYRVEEAAEVLGISRSKVYELIREGRIRFVKIGNSTRITKHALEAYVAELVEEQRLAHAISSPT